MASSPIYRALQNISQETTAVYEAIHDGIEGLCGLYLNHDERNVIVCDVSSTILESALRHGREDSSLTLTDNGGE